MYKTVKQVRDIDIIESELKESKVGVLVVHCEDEKIEQLPVTFIYKDKNIYFFFEKEDEFFDSIQLNTSGIFTNLKDERFKKSKKTETNPAYKFLSITIFGTIKKVEDVKVLDELKQSYARKYSSKEIGSELDFSIISQALMIDTEEIKALEEIGG